VRSKSMKSGACGNSFLVRPLTGRPLARGMHIKQRLEVVRHQVRPLLTFLVTTSLLAASFFQMFHQLKYDQFEARLNQAIESMKSCGFIGRVSYEGEV
jgi:hypothetical protein